MRKGHVVRWAGDGWEMAFLNRSSCADTTGWTDTNGRSCKDCAPIVVALVQQCME